MSTHALLPIFAAALLSTACGQSAFIEHALGGTEPIVVKIGYMPNAATLPTTIGDWADGQAPVPIADFVCNNIAALFPNRPCVAPRTIDQMYRLQNPFPDNVYDRDEMRALGASIPGAESDLRVIVLDGKPSFDQGSCDPGTVCVLGHTTPKQEGQRVIALFFPNIMTRADYLRGGYPLSFYLGYFFAATLTHEIGHGSGLVDNDVPMVVPHEDKNGHHCNNPSCIMAPDPINRLPSDWAQKRIMLGAAADNGFDDKCIQDIRSASH